MRVSPLPRCLRADHQPTLGHAIMTKLQAVIARRVVESLPGGGPQRLADHLGDEFEGVRNPGDKAQGLHKRPMVFAVELAISNEITRRGRLRKRRQQGLGSVLKNLAIRGVTSQLWLTSGTPPSSDTITSNTACFKSGRWSLE